MIEKKNEYGIKFDSMSLFDVECEF